MKFRFALLTLALSSQAMALQVYPEYNQVGEYTECSQNNIMKFKLHNTTDKAWIYVIKTEKYIHGYKEETTDLELSTHRIRVEPGRHYELTVKSNAMKKMKQQLYSLAISTQTPKTNFQNMNQMPNEMSEELTLEEFEELKNRSTGKKTNIELKGIIKENNALVVPILINGYEKPRNEIEFVYLGDKTKTLIYNKGSNVLFVPGDKFKYRSHYYILPEEVFVTSDIVLSHRIIKVGQNTDHKYLGCPIAQNKEISPMVNRYGNYYLDSFYKFFKIVKPKNILKDSLDLLT